MEGEKVKQGRDEFTSPRYGEWLSEKMQKRAVRERERGREKKNLIQIIFTPWALKCKSQIKEVWNGK